MSKSPSPPPSASPRHVVIADPDPRERERALKAIEMLRSAPDSELGELVLHTATDGREALALIEAHQPALVMCEVLLAGISGLALLRIAADTGVERASISRFVRGERSLRLDMADKLAAYFGLKLTRTKPNATEHQKKGRNDGDGV